MNFSTAAYNRLPGNVQPLVKRMYDRMHPHRISEKTIQRYRSNFVSTLFESQSEFDGYLDELHDGEVADVLSAAEENNRDYREGTGLNNEYFHPVYAYIRRTSPDLVVETGVRDGWSTLYILTALQQNQHGTLHSIDYPINEGSDNIEEFKRESPSYNDIAPTIPPETDPGWIVPESLKDRWNLVLGKSQEALPKLFTEIDEIDVFIHDSDHSHPCMTFGYELAWEWLNDDGVIFSDDIDWNSSFDDFVASKGCTFGKLTEYFGYMIKEYAD